MPFAAAKAVAATFCWKIRHILTPVFGIDFLSLCIHPDDPRFGRMVIDPSIIREATETANQYQLLEKPQPVAGPSGLSPQTPEQPHEYSDEQDAYPSWNQQEGGVMDSGEINENCTPPTLYSSKWTPANVSQSAKPRLPSLKHMLETPLETSRETPRNLWFQVKAPPTPTDIPETFKKPSTRGKQVGDGGYAEAGPSSQWAKYEKATPVASSSETEIEEDNDDDDMNDNVGDGYDYDDDHDEEETVSDDSCSDSEFNEEQEVRLARDTNAAQLLLDLHMRQETVFKEDEDTIRSKRRRASN